MNRHRLTCRAAMLMAHGATVAQALVTGLPLEEADDDRPC
jgi:hypothetical protein